MLERIPQFFSFALSFFLQVHVDAGKEDCYYQYVHPGATLYVSQQVLKGGDGAIGFAVKTPDGKVRICTFDPVSVPI